MGLVAGSMERASLYLSTSNDSGVALLCVASSAWCEWDGCRLGCAARSGAQRGGGCGHMARSEGQDQSGKARAPGRGFLESLVREL